MDYPVSAGASDIDTTQTSSMGRCIELCTDKRDQGCKGVTWKDGECALKKDVGTSKGNSGMILALGVQKPDGAD